MIITQVTNGAVASVVINVAELMVLRIAMQSMDVKKYEENIKEMGYPDEMERSAIAVVGQAIHAIQGMELYLVAAQNGQEPAPEPLEQADPFAKATVQ